MNDITALMATMKAAAEKATPGEWRAFTHPASGTYAIHTPKDKRCEDVIKWPGFDGRENAGANAKFVATANPANVLALVEALEKAQSQSSKWLEAYHKAVSVGARYEERIAELESRQPDLYLCRVKGDEELYSPCGKDYPRGRGYYVSPPSRTVTVKLYDDFQLCHYGTSEDYAKGYIDCQNNFTKWLAAASIQVIEGEQKNG